MNSESFQGLLLLLDPDPAQAAFEYGRLHARLVRVFEWNNVSDAQALADTAFDRMAKHVQEHPEEPVRSVASFLQGIARNLIREESRRVQRVAEAARTLEELRRTGGADEGLHARLAGCMERLAPEKRSLLESYYQYSGIAKVKEHAEAAKRLKISVNALRNRVMRIRMELETCMRKGL